MTPTIHRKRTAHGESITLLLGHGSVTIEITVREVELSASDVEKMLHAPLGMLLGGGRERI